MPRRSTFHRHALLAVAFPCLAAAWFGCAKGSGETTTGTLSFATGSGGSGGTGGGLVAQGGNGGSGVGGTCTFTSVESHPVPVDIMFLIDRSDSMEDDGKWTGTVSALTTFCSDPASTGIGAGLILFPYSYEDCNVPDYETPVVPIAPLPGNAFAITNALPADADIYGTPLWGALKGALMVATAYQDAHPTHKVNVVLATDGDPTAVASVCFGHGFDDTAAVAKSALDYDGVHTYVIGMEGSVISTLDEIAAAGGTNAAYDITQDISEFSAKMAEIRQVAIGCDFSLPAPPHGKTLNPGDVNVGYTPGGKGMADILPRAQNRADCGGHPGWYYDNNDNPTEIILCPASCSTVKDDKHAKISALFGCKSVLN